jgi:hypothetical protein
LGDAEAAPSGTPINIMTCMTTLNSFVLNEEFLGVPFLAKTCFVLDLVFIFSPFVFSVFRHKQEGDEKSHRR